MTYDEFVKNYHDNKIEVIVNRTKAAKILHSEWANKGYNYSTFAIDIIVTLLMFPATVYLLFFFSWKIATVCFALSIIIGRANQKTTIQYVLTNMLEDSKFYDYCRNHKAFEIKSLESIVTGTYLYEGIKVTISETTEGDIIALSEMGKQLSPLEVLTTGKKL